MDNQELKSTKVCKLKTLVGHFICLLITILTTSVNAKEIRLVLTHIPKVMEFGNSKAPYNQLIEHLNKKLPVNFSVEFMPSSRGNKLLNAAQIDCLFPIIPLTQRTTQTVISEPVNGISAYFFSTGLQVFSDLDQLKGKMVVYLRGYLFGGLVANHPEINFFAVSSQHAALGMLEKNRAVAYLDYIPDIRYVFNSEQMGKLKYDKTSPIVRDYDRFECLDTPSSKSFLNLINKEIQSIRTTGKLKTLLGKYYVHVVTDD